MAALQEMRRTVGELRAHLGEPTYVACEPRADGDGFGAINAARGSLGHWVRIRDGKIANYQVITPTAWNGSPRDNTGRRGHWEESFVGLEIADLDNPVELFHVVRSHDACLVCTVHLARGRGASRSFTLVMAAACVLCLGNRWHGDDGFGHHVFRRLHDARRAASERRRSWTPASPA